MILHQKCISWLPSNFENKWDLGKMGKALCSFIEKICRKKH